VSSDLVHADQRECKQEVEVDASQIGPEARRSRQRVAVRHVGKERRIDEIQADTHRSDATAAVAKTGRMSELVNYAADDDEPEHGQQQAGGVEHLE
jgi:hypothetical protein